MDSLRLNQVGPTGRSGFNQPGTSVVSNGFGGFKTGRLKTANKTGRRRCFVGFFFFGGGVENESLFGVKILNVFFWLFFLGKKS